LQEQEVTRSKVRGEGRERECWNVVFRQKFICDDSPVGRGFDMVRDPTAVAPLLRVMSPHSVTEALQDCSVEFLIHHLFSRNVLMMNQPVNVEERDQHGLLIGLKEMMPCSTGMTFALFPDKSRTPAFVTSDYRGHEVRIVLGSLMEVSAN